MARFEARALGSALRLFVAPSVAVRGVGLPGERPGGPATGADEAGTAAGEIWAAVLDEFDAVDRALSRFRADSELTALNRRAGTGAVVTVSWRLRVALATMDRARRITDGRFDASVLGALERIGEHGAELGGNGSGGLGHGAGGERSGLAVPAIASTAVGLERPRPVAVPAAPLDTGGIGKGLALRWAAARAASIAPDTGFLLEAGGDMIAVGCGPAGGWQIGIEDAVAPGPAEAPPVAVVALEAGAISTSSVLVRNWVAPDGRPVHHLVDPRTGEPARTRLIAVTVAGPDPAWTEVWTKSLFIAGRDRIGDEARARGLAAWWIDDAGRLGMTPEARVRCAWVAEDRMG